MSNSEDGSKRREPEKDNNSDVDASKNLTDSDDYRIIRSSNTTFSHLNRLNADLMEKNYSLMIEKAELEHTLRRKNNDINKLKKRVNKLIAKLKEFREPPLVVAEIMEELADGRFVVKNGVGHIYVVKNLASRDYDNDWSPGKRVMLDYKNLNVMEPLNSSKDPIVSCAQILERPATTYDDVGGLDEQIQRMTETVELPLTRPELYKRVGVKPPKGILLVGPPGNGKTLLAKAVANKTKAAFIRLVGSELVQKYIGEGSRLVRELFQLAREEAPSIIFIDEIDAVGAKRMGLNTSGDREVQRTLMQLLAEMDGFRPLENVSIIAATNRPDILDKALLRPGRFDRIIEIPPPNLEGIEKILEIHSSKLNLDWRVKKMIPNFALICEGMSGAEIQNICREAGMNTVRKEGTRVTVNHFIKAIEKIKASKGEDLSSQSKNNLNMYH